MHKSGVTAIEIHGQWASDTKLLPALVNTTAQNFQITEVSADKGYASRSNADAIANVRATPFISFMSSHTGKGGGTWEKMYHYFQFKRTEFLQHYHKRSNVESTFSMIKRKFGDSLRSKTDTAMVNETLCKFCVIILLFLSMKLKNSASRLILQPNTCYVIFRLPPLGCI